MLPLNHNGMRKGFALMEFVIYCGIAIAITASLVAAAIHAIKEKGRLGEFEAVLRSARLAEKIITDHIRSASSITTPLNATSTILILNFATGTTPVTFSIADGYIEITKESESPQRILDAGTAASLLEFKGTTSSSTQGVVQTSFTITSGSTSKAFNFTTNIYAHE